MFRRHNYATWNHNTTQKPVYGIKEKLYLCQYAK